MRSLKFDEFDREKVISEIEKHLHIKLTRVGRRKKCLSDQNGKTFWVLGGYKNWHGIPPDMIIEEKRKSTNGVLVVAKRDSAKIDIFSGSLQKLVNNSQHLSHTQNGDYQFNIDIRGDRLLIKEVPGLILNRIGVPAYEDSEKENDQNVQQAKEAFRQMTPEQRMIWLKELGIISDT